MNKSLTASSARTPLFHVSLAVLVAVTAFTGCQTGTTGRAELSSNNLELNASSASLVTKMIEARKVDENKAAQSTVAEKKSGSTTIKQVSFVQTGDELADSAVYSEPPSPDAISERDRFAVDLATVLQLAGADNWNVRIARERVKQAALNVEQADAAILPSLNFGLIYNVHDGEIQSTMGDVITASRNSLFIGGGAGIANSPLNGGAGGPARLFVDFSLADAYFKPLAARQRFAASRSQKCSVLNDTLLEATLAYYELVRAQSLLSISTKNLAEAEQVAQLTADFVESGKGSEADVHRTRVIVNQRKTQFVRSTAAIEVASARLAEILQLDPCEMDPEVGLLAVEYQPLPIEIIDWNVGLNQQVDLAQESRCEISQAIAEAQSLSTDHEAELWRAVLPNLYLGYSGGVFGGGQGSDLPGLDWRGDLDVGLTWQIKNLGLGNAIAQDSTESRYRQQIYVTRQIRDKVTQQVTSTYHTARQYQQEIDLVSSNVKQSELALSKNIDAIRGLEGLPLEATQSLKALADSRVEYLNSVISYNQWQLRLLRATGQPFADQDCCGQNCRCCNCNGKCTSIPCAKRCDCGGSNPNCRHVR